MKRLLCALLAALLLTGAALAGEIDPQGQGIGLEGVGNARELGGYVAGDGRTVRRGVFLRTAALTGATDGDLRRLREEFHLSVVLDLRMTSEIESGPDPQIEGVRNLHLGIMDEDAMAARRQSCTPEDAEALRSDDPVERIRALYRLGIVGDRLYIDFLSGEPGRAGYARMFRELLDLPEGEALLFHCTQGKDRTGCAAMLILAALGVDEETILADYMLTNEFNAERIRRQRQALIDQGVAGEDLDMCMAVMDEVFPGALINALDWMRENYGSPLGYITGELGVTEAQIEALREKYLEGKIEYEDAA